MNKKLRLSLTLTMILVLSLIIVLTQKSKLNKDYLSISEYNNTYQQPEDDNMLSLDEYKKNYTDETITE